MAARKTTPNKKPDESVIENASEKNETETNKVEAVESLNVIYNGPHDAVNVGDFGEHKKGVKKTYPVNIANELVENSKRNKFEIVK